ISAMRSLADRNSPSGPNNSTPQATESRTAESAAPAANSPRSGAALGVSSAGFHARPGSETGMASLPTRLQDQIAEQNRCAQRRDQFRRQTQFVIVQPEFSVHELLRFASCTGVTKPGSGKCRIISSFQSGKADGSRRGFPVRNFGGSVFPYGKRR